MNAKWIGTMIDGVLTNSIRLVPWKLRSAIKGLPILGGLQRKILSRALDGVEFVHKIDAGPAKGLIYPVVLPADKGAWTGTYELDFVCRLASAIKPGDVCFDVGGWRGFFAGVMAMSGASKTIVFEPMDSNGARIRRLLELNPGLPIVYEPVAVGENNGSASFNVMPQTSMGKLVTSPFQPDAAGCRQVSVDVVSLDQYCEANQIDAVNVIKMDVEGAEVMALRGAERLLRGSHPRLFVEAHSRELAKEVVEFLRPLGYNVTTLETGCVPDGHTEPEVCHLDAVPTNNMS